MRLVIAVVTLVFAVNALSEKAQWESFKVKHAKFYRNAAEENYRYSVFLNALKEINKHNAKYEAGLSSYKMGVNQFADLTTAEFIRKIGNQKLSKPKIQAEQHEFLGLSKLPESLDWRDTGAVTDVEDQGDCGSCWAFGAKGAMEGQNYLKNKVTVPLSAQELIDCSLDYGPNDCENGGEEIFAYNYVADNGIMTEEDYPYTEVQSSCKVNGREKAFKIKGYKNLTQSEEALKEAVATIGPISVGIYGDLLQWYEWGIFDDVNCVSNASLIDHSVLAVGYGTENGTDYWNVKNSWGIMWGESGFFQLKRGIDLCGISLEATYPVV